jgi:hypothetical protein
VKAERAVSFARIFAVLGDDATTRVRRQHLCLSQTAPSGADGHVNISPRARRITAGVQAVARVELDRVSRLLRFGVLLMEVDGPPAFSSWIRSFAGAPAGYHQP